MARAYNRWTSKEIETLRRGEVPEGRTYSQSSTRAHKLGIDWKAARAGRGRFWTEEELKQVAEGGRPEGRTLAACRQTQRLKGLKRSTFKPTYEEAERLLGQEDTKGWTINALRKALKGKALPPCFCATRAKGRALAEALASGKVYTREMYEAASSLAERAYLMHCEGVPYSEIGKRLGLSHTGARHLVLSYAKKWGQLGAV